MLKDNVFIPPESMTKFSILIIVLMLLSVKILFIFLFVYSIFLILFRKKIINSALIQNTDSHFFLAPCEGQVIRVFDKGNKKRIELKVKPFNYYGISMPFSGAVKSYLESKRKLFNLGKTKVYRYYSKIELSSEELGTVSLFFKEKYSFARARIWCRSGDLGSIGAYLGYLPFGGKIVIEFSNDLDVLVKRGDKLLSFETLMASRGK